MIKRKHVKTILCCLVFTVCLLPGSAQPQQANNAKVSKANIGRENPFAKLPRKNIPRPVTQRISEPDITEAKKPKLFVETVTLKFLDATSLKVAIEGLSSEYGRISTDDKSNSLIICDTNENLEVILTQIQRADKLTAEAAMGGVDSKPELSVESVTLKFLDATNLMAAIGSMSSEHGSISTDAKSNSLIVCDTRENLEMILAEIRKADRTPEQVMIEVVIIDVQLDDETEIGVNWSRLFEPKEDVTYAQTLVDTLSGAATAGADFSIIKTGISGTLHALQETRNIEILASPRVLVVSGEEAFIQTVEEIPYEETSDTAQGGAAALTSTEFKNVGVTLRVKATVTEDEKILMTIEPEQSVKTGESINNVPVVDTRGVETSLLMEDGQVVVMGGLRRKETRHTVKKIPLLGDLPLIGFLFSDNKEEVNHSELVVLLSPHIYKGEAVDEEVMSKFKEIQDRPMLSLPPKGKNAAEELISILPDGN